MAARCGLVKIGQRDNLPVMRDLLILAIHLLVTFAKLLRPGGARRVAAESLLLKRQLLVSNRSRRRAPNLTMLDRLVLARTDDPLREPSSHFKTICEHQAHHTI
jgi:hypothetical protein